MNINFTQIFQDCWNFMRNQKKITQQFIFFFFISSLIFYFLLTSVVPMPEITQANGQNLPLPSSISAQFVIIGVAQQLVSLFISSWGILTFHRISVQQQNPLNQSAVLTLQRFAGVVTVSVIGFIPLMIGVVESLFAILQGQYPSILSLVAMLLGFFIFVRLSLASTEYLIQPVGIMQALKNSWLSGVKRSAPLFIYCLLIYVVLPFVVRRISSLSDNLVFDVIMLFVSAAVGVFSLLFTYRFYTLFMHKDQQ
ncbi:hypothetical protein L5B71_00815 [Avibacterium sp. 21-586]|uniref:hypothetical protein n=1 Tax=Avibacterium sp. 21-586 TaxID=2911534 RepID=UPI002245BA48|nr:hypothetical protein [Avibacterium sp. 21-586]MCW9709439.1 hypothetical protein [Avibacterium sp. 21-586]